ncbi:hypothetical protein RM533_00375 [Croceicoccus sp. F390]|uniref:Haemolysin activator HlyB C-terminal domain-containing protein n=1 Tax=Croceicoccus esteveae TaxID=3075597 RepID=A0ABU2ZDF5_9SPHN|nr:hypothetical protein [Croceicoccus sp. F390]MDT0574632.1 hypothetical protein [Croceicoccus sp. F390]
MSKARMRGAPVAALAGVLGVWVVTRIVAPGAGPFDAQSSLALEGMRGGMQTGIAQGDAADATGAEVIRLGLRQLGDSLSGMRDVVAGDDAPAWLRHSAPTRPVNARLASVTAGSDRRSRSRAGQAPNTVVTRATTDFAALSASSESPAQPAGSGSGAMRPVPLYASAVDPRQQASSRWTGDGWVLVRGSGADAAAIGAAAYGGSQAGAIIRYDLAQQSRYRPRIYARLTSELDGSSQAEIAGGASIRPFVSLPLELLGEVRVGRFSGDTKVRPAVIAVANPAPIRLPYGFTAESYAQAGYVGGSFSTAFADGQLRAIRDMVRLNDRISVTAGAGMWGGVQKGAGRIDVGPTVSAVAPVGKGVYARASLDYRQRVAGDAQPGSGPVFTVAAGF